MYCDRKRYNTDGDVMLNQPGEIWNVYDRGKFQSFVDLNFGQIAA